MDDRRGLRHISPDVTGADHDLGQVEDDGRCGDLVGKAGGAADLLLAERQGNVPQALEAYRQVLTVNPQNLDARLRLGILLEQTDQSGMKKREDLSLDVQ